MKLYHGTSASYVQQILRDGIQPRSTTGISNYGESADAQFGASHPSHVYLSDVYGPVYALQHEDTGGAIVEIDMDTLSEDALLPDEDYLLGLVYAAYGPGKDHPTLYRPSKRLTDALGKGIAKTGLGHLVDAYVESGSSEYSPTSATKPLVEGFRDNIQVFHALWKDSLKQLGTLAHVGVVPASAICHIVRFEALDSCVAEAICSKVRGATIVNHGMRKTFGRSFTKWFFGSPLSPWTLNYFSPSLHRQLRSALGGPVEPEPTDPKEIMLQKHQDREYADLENALKQRRGVSMVYRRRS